MEEEPKEQSDVLPEKKLAGNIVENVLVNANNTLTSGPFGKVFEEDNLPAPPCKLENINSPETENMNSPRSDIANINSPTNQLENIESPITEDSKTLETGYVISPTPKTDDNSDTVNNNTNEENKKNSHQENKENADQENTHQENPVVQPVCSSESDSQIVPGISSAMKEEVEKVQLFSDPVSEPTDVEEPSKQGPTTQIGDVTESCDKPNEVEPMEPILVSGLTKDEERMPPCEPSDKPITANEVSRVPSPFEHISADEALESQDSSIVTANKSQHSNLSLEASESRMISEIFKNTADIETSLDKANRAVIAAEGKVEGDEDVNNVNGFGLTTPAAESNDSLTEPSGYTEAAAEHPVTSSENPASNAHTNDPEVLPAEDSKVTAERETKINPQDYATEQLVATGDTTASGITPVEDVVEAVQVSSVSEVAADSAEVAAKSPEVAPAIPEVAAKSPEVAAKSSEVTAKSPEVAAKSPEVAAKSPELAAKSPEVAVVTPEVRYAENTSVDNLVQNLTPEGLMAAPAISLTAASNLDCSDAKHASCEAISGSATDPTVNPESAFVTDPTFVTDAAPAPETIGGVDIETNCATVGSASDDRIEVIDLDQKVGGALNRGDGLLDKELLVLTKQLENLREEVMKKENKLEESVKLSSNLAEELRHVHKVNTGLEERHDAAMRQIERQKDVTAALVAEKSISEKRLEDAEKRYLELEKNMKHLNDKNSQLQRHKSRTCTIL